MNCLKVRLKRLWEGIHNDRGITLIEILIVLAIIAILGVVVVPRFIDEPNKARVTAVKMQIKSLSLALDKYYFDKGSYPSQEIGLSALVEEKYMKKIPQDPWGNPYVYTYPGVNDTSTYELKSLGADGQEGGEGFNADISSND